MNDAGSDEVLRILLLNRQQPIGVFQSTSPERQASTAIDVSILVDIEPDVVEERGNKSKGGEGNEQAFLGIALQGCLSALELGREGMAQQADEKERAE